MLLLAFLCPPLEAHLLFLFAPCLACLGTLSLESLTLLCECLLRLGAHGWSLQRLRSISHASLGILCEFGSFWFLVAVEDDLLPASYDELQNLLV